jgi:hypothetical protein
MALCIVAGRLSASSALRLIRAVTLLIDIARGVPVKVLLVLIQMAILGGGEGERKKRSHNIPGVRSTNMNAKSVMPRWRGVQSIPSPPPHTHTDTHSSRTSAALTIVGLVFARQAGITISNLSFVFIILSVRHSMYLPSRVLAQSDGIVLDTPPTADVYDFRKGVCIHPLGTY